MGVLGKVLLVPNFITNDKAPYTGNAVVLLHVYTNNENTTKHIHSTHDTRLPGTYDTHQQNNPLTPVKHTRTTTHTHTYIPQNNFNTQYEYIVMFTKITFASMKEHNNTDTHMCSSEEQSTYDQQDNEHQYTTNANRQRTTHL